MYDKLVEIAPPMIPYVGTNKKFRNIFTKTPIKIDVKINFSFFNANNAPDKICIFKLLNKPIIKIWSVGNTLRYSWFTNDIIGTEKK